MVFEEEESRKNSSSVSNNPVVSSRYCRGRTAEAEEWMNCGTLKRFTRRLNNSPKRMLYTYEVNQTYTHRTPKSKSRREYALSPNTDDE